MVSWLPKFRRQIVKVCATGMFGKIGQKSLENRQNCLASYAFKTDQWGIGNCTNHCLVGLACKIKQVFHPNFLTCRLVKFSQRGTRIRRNCVTSWAHKTWYVIVQNCTVGWLQKFRHEGTRIRRNCIQNYTAGRLRKFQQWGTTIHINSLVGWAYKSWC